jgi:hypothetical protein
MVASARSAAILIDAWVFPRFLSGCAAQRLNDLFSRSVWWTLQKRRMSPMLASPETMHSAVHGRQQ